MRLFRRGSERTRALGVAVVVAVTVMAGCSETGPVGGEQASDADSDAGNVMADGGYKAISDEGPVIERFPDAQWFQGDLPAKAEADDAIPVPIGNELRETTRARRPKPSPASARMRSRCSDTRAAALAVVSVPSITTSSAASAGSNSTVVVVVAASRFIEMDEFRGRRNASSLRPQYLTKAMLGCAKAPVDSIDRVYHQIRLISYSIDG